MYTLYWSTRTAAFFPDAMLSKAGADFERREVKRVDGRVADPAFEKISPMKQIPALVLPDGTVLCESVAISLTLAERHPEAAMLPEPASDQRAMAYRWVMHLVCNVYECDLRHSYPDRYTANPDGVAGVRKAAETRWDRSYEVIEEALGDGPWFLGRDYSLLDVMLAAMVCWHYDTPALLARSPKIRRICLQARTRDDLAPLFEMYGLNDLDHLL